MDQTWTSEQPSQSSSGALQVDERVAILAELYLRACAVGAPCNDLAEAMANAILESEVVRLAQAVLRGAKHRHASATELAARVLEAAQDRSTRSQPAAERSRR